MREIKFKVWDIGKKIFLPTDVYALTMTDFGAFGVMLKDFENYREGEYLYPDAQVLVFWTGLKDKNGVDIYEGDILKTRYGTLFSWNNLVDYHLWDINNSNAFSEVVIIGNIYQNPELLTVN